MIPGRANGSGASNGAANKERDVAELTPEDMKDIQGFVVSGYAHLPCVNYSLLRVDDPVTARRWLGNLTFV